MATVPHCETDVEGLFFCGASTPAGHGIAAVRFSPEVLGDRALLPALTGWDARRESH